MFWQLWLQNQGALALASRVPTLMVVDHSRARGCFSDSSAATLSRLTVQPIFLTIFLSVQEASV